MQRWWEGRENLLCLLSVKAASLGCDIRQCFGRRVGVPVF